MSGSSQIPEDTCDSYHMLSSTTWTKCAAWLIAKVMPGCVLIDKYKRLPTADWYFVNILTSGGVAMGLQLFIPNFLSMSSVWVSRPIQRIPALGFCTILTLKNFLSCPKFFTSTLSDNADLTSLSHFSLLPASNMSSTYTPIRNGSLSPVLYKQGSLIVWAKLISFSLSSTVMFQHLGASLKT